MASYADQVAALQQANGMISNLQSAVKNLNESSSPEDFQEVNQLIADYKRTVNTQFGKGFEDIATQTNEYIYQAERTIAPIRDKKLKNDSRDIFDRMKLGEEDENYISEEAGKRQLEDLYGGLGVGGFENAWDDYKADQSTAKAEEKEDRGFGLVEEAIQIGKDEDALRAELADEMLKEAELSPIEVEQETSRASSEVLKSFQKAKKATGRSLQRMGINPNSDKYAYAVQGNDLGEAATLASAKNQTRMGLKAQSDANKTNARAIRLGLNPMSIPALGAGANYSLSGAGMNMGAAGMYNQNPFARAGLDLANKNFGLKEKALNWQMSQDNEPDWKDLLMSVAGAAGGYAGGRKLYDFIK